MLRPSALLRVLSLPSMLQSMVPSLSYLGGEALLSLDEELVQPPVHHQYQVQMDLRFTHLFQLLDYASSPPTLPVVWLWMREAFLSQLPSPVCWYIPSSTVEGHHALVAWVTSHHHWENLTDSLTSVMAVTSSGTDWFVGFRIPCPNPGYTGSSTQRTSDSMACPRSYSPIGDSSWCIWRDSWAFLGAFSRRRLCDRTSYLILCLHLVFSAALFRLLA